MMYLKKNWSSILLWTGIIAYILYFSILTIARYKTLYASYFDLGIMHQTVYNTYKSIAEFDFSRFLELTNPYGIEQIKRMSIHNDILLAVLSPFYFIFSGPETLLVIQTVALAFGAWALYYITQIVFAKQKYRDLFSVIFALLYLLNPVMERTNIFDFHAVTLATSLLLFMFYFWLKRIYWASLIFFVLAILSKEQVPLTTLFFGLYVLYIEAKVNKFTFKKWQKYLFSVTIIFLSISWFALTMLVIIPAFRGGSHFAIGYYGDFGDSPTKVIFGVFENPASIFHYLFHIDTAKYFFYMLGPLGFLALFAPLQLFITIPEFAVNLLSSNWNMRNIIYHYTAVLQPFICIASIYGAYHFLNLKSKFLNRYLPIQRRSIFLATYIVMMTLLFAYFKGPLPYAREQEIHPFKYPQKEYKDIQEWAKRLSDEKLKISTTGQLAPYFTSRRYFYIFSRYYGESDYIIIRPDEVYLYPEKDDLVPVYEKLIVDPNYVEIFDNNGLEVYKRNIYNAKLGI